jgi:outer membrane protein
MNVFTRVSALAFIALFVALGSAQAQVKLGFVNTETIVQQMPEFKDIDAKLRTIQSAYADTLRAMEINYKTRLEAYQKQQSMMTADARTKEEDQLRGIAEQYQQYQQDRLGPQGKLAQRQAEFIQPIRDKVRAAIEKVARDEKLSGVMENSVMIYFDSKLDITYKVLDNLRRGTN